MLKVLFAPKSCGENLVNLFDFLGANNEDELDG